MLVHMKGFCFNGGAPMLIRLFKCTLFSLVAAGNEELTIDEKGFITNMN
jgi:hypothetical protein